MTMTHDEKVLERIPRTFSCGGQRWTVNMVDRIDGNNLGECRDGECTVMIADIYNKDARQDGDCKVNTFYHELVHAILANIGQDELNDDHKFVCSFAALLTESMKDARFIVRQCDDEK